MTVDQCRMLEQLNGWEMAVHSGTNAAHDAKFADLTESQLAADFAFVNKWMIDNGFSGGADHLAYLGGSYDDKTLRQVRRFFTSARAIAEQNQEKTFPQGDPHRLRIINCFNTRTAAQIIAEIEKAIAEKSWLILVLHRIVAPDTDDIGTEFPTNDLEPSWPTLHRPASRSAPRETSSGTASPDLRMATRGHPYTITLCNQRWGAPSWRVYLSGVFGSSSFAYWALPRAQHSRRRSTINSASTQG